MVREYSRLNGIPYLPNCKLVQWIGTDTNRNIFNCNISEKYSCFDQCSIAKGTLFKFSRVYKKKVDKRFIDLNSHGSAIIYSDFT